MRTYEQKYEIAKKYISQSNLEDLNKFLIEEQSFLTTNTNAHPNLLDSALEAKQIPSIILLINQGFITKNTSLLSTMLLSSPLYFYSDEQKNFQFSISIPKEEHKRSYFSRIVDISHDPELPLKLMDKYLYKSIRHEKYDRDIKLGKKIFSYTTGAS